MATVPVVPTLSPSMDIQISSNFERLLFDLHGRDGVVRQVVGGGLRLALVGVAPEGRQPQV